MTSQDDEITRELVQIQAELREQARINNERKSKLFSVAKKWMAYQEFNSILDEGDKLIDSVYTRRLKSAKKSKKKPPKETKNVPENVMQMITRRNRLLDEIAPVFSEMEVPAAHSIFE